MSTSCKLSFCIHKIQETHFGICVCVSMHVNVSVLESAPMSLNITSNENMSTSKRIIKIPNVLQTEILHTQNEDGALVYMYTPDALDCTPTRRCRNRAFQSRSTCVHA